MEPNVPTNPVLKPGTYQGAPIPLQETPGVRTPRAIHSMKSDMADAITKQNETAASIALAEARKQEQQLAVLFAAQQAELARIAALPPKPKGHRWVIVVILIIVVLPIVAGVAYKFLAPKPLIISLPLLGDVNFGKEIPPKVAAPKGPPPLAPSLITAQTEKRFVFSSETPEHVSAMIAVERTGGLPVDTIKNLYFSEAPLLPGDPIGVSGVSAKRLFSFMRVLAPEVVTRSLEPHFMLGLLGQAGFVSAPFIILKVSDHDALRAGMLQWEPTLSNSFEILFATKIISDTNKFIDTIIGGKDARTISSTSDASISYAFADATTLVIAGSRTTLGEILLRLAK